MDNAARRGYGEEPPTTSRRHTLSAGVQHHPITVLREVIPEGSLQEVDLKSNRIQLGDWEPSLRSPSALLMSSPEFLVAHLELEGWRLSCREARHLAMVIYIESCSCERAPRSCTSTMGWHLCRFRSCAIGSCNSPLLDEPRPRG